MLVGQQAKAETIDTELLSVKQHNTSILISHRHDQAPTTNCTAIATTDLVQGTRLPPHQPRTSYPLCSPSATVCL